MRTSFIVALLAMTTTDSSAVRLNTEQFDFNAFSGLAGGLATMGAGMAGKPEVAEGINSGLNAANSMANGDVGGGLTGALTTVGGAVGGDAGAGMTAASQGVGNLYTAAEQGDV
jgi:hypothetical protein